MNEPKKVGKTKRRQLGKNEGYRKGANRKIERQRENNHRKKEGGKERKQK